MAYSDTQKISKKIKLLLFIFNILIFNWLINFNFLFYCQNGIVFLDKWVPSVRNAIVFLDNPVPIVRNGIVFLDKAVSIVRNGIVFLDKEFPVLAKALLYKQLFLIKKVPRTNGELFSVLYLSKSISF